MREGDSGSGAGDSDLGSAVLRSRAGATRRGGCAAFVWLFGPRRFDGLRPRPVGGAVFHPAPFPAVVAAGVLGRAGLPPLRDCALPVRGHRVCGSPAIAQRGSLWSFVLYHPEQFHPEGIGHHCRRGIDRHGGWGIDVGVLPVRLAQSEDLGDFQAARLRLARKRQLRQSQHLRGNGGNGFAAGAGLHRDGAFTPRRRGCCSPTARWS